MKRVLMMAAVLAAGSALAGSITIDQLDITASRAAVVTGVQSQLVASAIQTELDPVWAAVSNTVTAGAAAGATALPLSGGTMTGPIASAFPVGGSTDTPWSLRLNPTASSLQVADGALWYDIIKIDTGVLSIYDPSLPGIIFNSGTFELTGRAWGSPHGPVEDSDYLRQGDGDARYVQPAAMNNALAAKADTNHTHAISSVTGLQTALDGKQSTEGIVTGAVVTATSGNRYYWASGTNVTLSVELTAGEVVNLAKINNTATNSITAIGQIGWEWTGGDMTNTITAGKSMTFGFLVDAVTGKTNAYATAVSQ